MLTDDNEIKIIADAKQKNVRDPNRSRQHFHNIFRDFFSGVAFFGRYLDMGPGQYDFCELARAKGGSCVGMDFDPPVIKLGQYKGFETIDMNIQKLPDSNIRAEFDGVFNKFALNAFWFWKSDEKHEAFIDSLCAMLKPNGWAWIAPWNGIPKNAEISKPRISEVLNLQKSYFENRGFATCQLSERESRDYGVHGKVANNCVFTRNLNWEKRFK